ncbi:hypothetical protein KPH14_006072 [Odynerus spinipes]|uniref:Ataxin-10 n=1 Tax=Odynerus spinipes TaxID=1348599 RepID=A0AAD9RK09_9HYME|nr:hypothetical protein KPH14_006072 [Odynerus spinipes]
MADENNLLNILNTSLVTRNWDNICDNLNPKTFGIIKSGQLFKVLAKIAEILTNESIDVPDKVKIIFLKCLGNSCLNAYAHADYELTKAEYGKYSKELYIKLAEDSSKFQSKPQEEDLCPRKTYFPYTGIAEWTVDYIIKFNELTLVEEWICILRLSIQFLCNLFTFACNNINSLQCKSIKDYLNNATFKNAITKLISFEDNSVSRAVCMFIHNALEKFGSDYFTNKDKSHVCSQLLKKAKDLKCARDALLRLLNEAEIFKNVYEDISAEDRLCLLEIIYQEAQEVIYHCEKGDVEFTFSQELICFLSEHFRRRSDLVLKTKETYLKDVEPMEIIILLDILGVLTSEASDKLCILQKDKSLLINCCYLLKALHMSGKESENYFTPIQRLSDVAPAKQGGVIEEKTAVDTNVANERKNEGEVRVRTENVKENKQDIRCHPAFGFKAGLIRLIGNMCYKNKECQDFVRETDSISLLLDCCNIDARNPLIMQWTILAVRNLCEGNFENQKIIRGCTKVGVVDSAILNEMGVTLHEDEDGRSIGIVPLPREKGL